MLHLLIFSRFFFCGRRPKSEKKRKKKFKRTKQNFQKKNYNFFPAFFAAFFFKALTRIDDLRSKFSKKKTIIINPAQQQQPRDITKHLSSQISRTQ